MHEQSKAFLMAGGGTLGSVTPLLAIAGKLRERDANVSLAWIGTPDGPERLVVESQRIPFYKLSSPKLDRYRTWTWPLLPFRLAISFLHALRLLYVVKPHMVFSAGGYVSVPVAWAAWVMRIPVWLHQLDTLPLLASKAIAPVAKKISVTFEETAAAFSAKKTVVVGTMVRQALRKGDKSVALKRYGFDEAKPTVLVIGGGTGAASVNELFAVIVDELTTHANVIHLVGRGKMLSSLEGRPNYAALEFLNEGMADAYAAADVVVCRAGLGTISELVALGKPSIVIPIHDPFQEANARLLEDKGAAHVLWYVTPQILAQAITRLLENSEQRETYAKHIRALCAVNADERIVHDALAMLE